MILAVTVTAQTIAAYVLLMVSLAVVLAWVTHTDWKLNKIQETAEATHALVNSASLVQLRLHAVAARRIAGLTGNKDDKEAADLAEKLALEHAEKQDKANAQTKG